MMTNMLRIVLIALTGMLLPGLANAWWQEDWSFRKEITLDTSATGANIAQDVTDAPVLVRLHTGNFGYFLDLKDKGQDLRFIADDDVTPLKFHIEKLDPINEMALIWVRIPQLKANSNTQKIWMYYGNPNAVDGQDRGGSFGTDQALVYHFDTDAATPRDATAYGNDASLFTAQLNSGSLMASGVVFNGESQLVIPANPVLAVDATRGWTFSTWIKIDQPQQDALLLSRGGEGGRVSLRIDGQSLYARVEDGSSSAMEETPRNAGLTPGSWHHIGLALSVNRAEIWLDGAMVAYVSSPVPVLRDFIALGNDAVLGNGFVGELDEVRIDKTLRPDSWWQLVVRNEGPAPGLLVYGEDGSRDSGDGDASYFTTTLKNVTLDGWVVIVFLSIMAVISWVVMASKGLVINRTGRDNQSFLEQFAALGARDVDNLDTEDSGTERELRESPLMMALSGRHQHFESSSLYRIYHAGVTEMHNRMPKTIGAQAAGLTLTPQAIDAIRATMDAVLTRENQKLNSQMVLLTIAISGGPFLGLLGTVVGVMITFAAIAASGDVNVNSIAPGIAAALVATVAGLAVAIPALFGYNYLGSRIKEISADMHVFVDEFVAKIAEQHS